MLLPLYAHHLKLILPELFLSCLIQEGKISDMMAENVAQDRKLRVGWSNFAMLGPEGCPKSLKGGRRS